MNICFIDLVISYWYFNNEGTEGLKSKHIIPDNTQINNGYKVITYVWWNAMNWPTVQEVDDEVIELYMQFFCEFIA